MAPGLEDWDALAPLFDRAPHHGLKDPAVLAAWTGLLTSRLPSPPARVLDVGCGTGTLTALLSRHRYDAHGLDLSGGMLRQARAKARLPWVRGDAADPPYRRRSFDAVLGRQVLSALPDPAAALACWAQLVRPGGRLLLVDGRWPVHRRGEPRRSVGLTAAQAVGLLTPYAAAVSVLRLGDPRLWGGPVRDERYLVLAVLREA